MNLFLIAAAVLAFLVGLTHSVLGEVRIFSRLRQGGLVPSAGTGALKESHVRILWATWHAVTGFGWAMAVLLIWTAAAAPLDPFVAPMPIVIAGGMALGSLLVLVGTRGRHLGWVGLGAVAVLIGLSYVN